MVIFDAMNENSFLNVLKDVEDHELFHSKNYFFLEDDKTLFSLI
jgi:hypothetical protein